MSSKTISLTAEIDNFLKFLENVESASMHTVKSYKLDLYQAFFQIKKSSDKLTKLNQLQLEEDKLLATARKALINWGHLSPASRNRKGATLKSFFNYLFNNKKISRPLSYLIQTPKIPKKIPHYISIDEVLSILKIAKSESRLLFLILYGAGLRISEGCHLESQNIDLKNGILKIVGKGQKERLVAFPTILKKELLKKLKQNNTKYIWGEIPLPQRKAYSMIKNLGLEANLLRPLHPHALRHSFATHLLSSGANLRTLQELLGHQSLQATEKYTHISIDQLARTMDSVHPLKRL